jgi:excisionase family DNA binding protein
MVVRSGRLVKRDARVRRGGVREYSIGEAARVVGVSPSTVRQWVDIGLVPVRRTRAGHRRFDVSAIGNLHRVRDLRETQHLPLENIRERINESPGPRAGADGAGATQPRSEPSESRLGERLRVARKATRISLRALAERAHVSASHLSAVERGHARPSVATLQRLTGALGITVGSLRSPGSAPCALVRGGEAGLLEVGIPGVVIEDLAPAARALEPQLFTLAPGAGSGGGYEHEGEEFLYVLAGTIEVVLDGVETYRVGAGDSLCFPSARAHRWRNPGRSPARLLWVNTPPTF